MVERYELLKELSRQIKDELVVFYRVGIACFEWAELTSGRDGNIIIGDMGCTTGIGIGLAKALPHRRVIVVDGDGSILLEPGVLVVLANCGASNLTVLVHDNESYESIGWTDKGRFRTETHRRADIEAIARGAGVAETCTVRTLPEFTQAIQRALSSPALHLIVAKTADQPAQARPRHTSTKEEKYRFVRYIERVEGIRIIRLSVEKEQLVDRRVESVE